ncbi:hypothetical protein DFQ26_000121 [Actinomortierella ambigua]|nr:hypothetical protein DFQ26_000121 [Actinomortierella ambigua]
MNDPLLNTPPVATAAATETTNDPTHIIHLANDQPSSSTQQQPASKVSALELKHQANLVVPDSANNSPPSSTTSSLEQQAVKQGTAATATAEVVEEEGEEEEEEEEEESHTDTGAPLVVPHSTPPDTTVPHPHAHAPKAKLKRPPLRPVSLSARPQRSILKKESSYPFIDPPARSAIFKSQWLQNTVNKLAVMTGPAPLTAYTDQSPSMFRKLVSQATAAANGNPTSPPPTTNGPQPLDSPLQRRPTGIQFSRNLNGSGSSSSSLLSTKSLKRVQFSVGHLTTEHIFHPDDAYESAEEGDGDNDNNDSIAKRNRGTLNTEHHQQQREQAGGVEGEKSGEVLTTPDGVVVDDNIYTAKEILNYYLIACNNREEAPIDRLVLAMRIAASRADNPLLQVIDLSGEPLPRKTLDPIADVLTLEFGLTHLILDNCSLDDDTFKVLLHSLLLTDTLAVLSLQDNKKIKQMGFKYISVYLKKTKTLRYLNLSNIPMDKKSAEFLGFALRIGRLGFGSRLEELHLDNCGLRGPVLETLAPALRETNIRKLSIKNNRIGAMGGVWLGVLLRDYDDNPSVPVPNNNEEQGFRRVFPGASNPELLKRTRGIEILDLSNNDLRTGTDYVAQTLRRNQSLKYLSLANNNMDANRLVVLADALKFNTGLQTLDLSQNSVCGPMATGITALKNKMTVNKTLTKLVLANTNLQSEGAIALAEFLPETKSLAYLDLTGNDLVDIAGVMALAVSIRMNSSLICLDLNVPPNDAEFARLSQDILRACVRNMEATTGSNQGMPSPDSVPITTIFQQTSPTNIPEQLFATDVLIQDDSMRWRGLENTARVIYIAKDHIRTLQRHLMQERSRRLQWLKHQEHLLELIKELPEGARLEPTEDLIIDREFDKKQRDFLQGIKSHGPPEAEQLFNMCKRDKINVDVCFMFVDNERALNELQSVRNMLLGALGVYLDMFEHPDPPTTAMPNMRSSSLPPLVPVHPAVNGHAPPQGQAGTDPNVQPGRDSSLSPSPPPRPSSPPSSSPSSDGGQPHMNGSLHGTTEVTGSEPPILGTVEDEALGPGNETFSLTDDDDLDDELGLDEVRRHGAEISERLVKEFQSGMRLDKEAAAAVTTGVPTTAMTADDGDDFSDNNKEGDALVSEERPGRGSRPAPIRTMSNNVDHESGRLLEVHSNKDGESDRVSLSSPLEVMRKAAEEEEGEVLRRGRELIENGLESDLAEEVLSGEELKQQILGSPLLS